MSTVSDSKRRRGKPKDPTRHDVAVRRPSPLSLWHAPVLLVLAGLLVDANACRATFLFDDESTVLTNPHMLELWSRSVFGGPPQSAVAGRPIVALTLAVNYALGQLNPWGYHAWNLGIHLLATLVLYGVLRRTLSNARMPSAIRASSTGLAFSIALIWLVHPLHTEVVDYVTERTESTMGLFYFLTLYAAIRACSTDEHRGRWSAVAVVACALGMATKESMVTAPVMVLLYDVVFVAGSVRTALHERRWLYLGLAVTWVPLALLIAPGPRWRSAGFKSGVSPWTYLLNQPAFILTYLKLAFWPSPLVLDYGVTRPTTLLAAVPTGLVVVTLLGLTVFAWVKSRPLAFLATWFWITLAPTSSILPIATEVGAERRMYLPLASVVILVVLAFFWLMQRSGNNWRRVAIATLAIACGALAWLTVARNREYQSEVSIWQTVLERHPHSRAHYNMGLALAKAGRSSEGVEHFRLAMDEEPRAHYALAVGLEKAGKLNEAEAEYETFLNRVPDDFQAPEGYVRLGVVLTEQDKLDRAVIALEKAITMRPQNPDGHVALADALMKQGHYEEASRHYAEYVRRVQNDPGAYQNFALSLIAQKREADAIPLLERAATLDPRNGGTRLSLGNALAAVGRDGEAVVQYRQGIELVPTSPVLHVMLAGALIRLGQLKDALPVLKQALTLRPDDDELRDTYAQLQRVVERAR